MPDPTAQLNQNPPSNPVNQQPIPPAPNPAPTPSSDLPSNRSSKPLLVVTMAIIFLAILGFTGYLYIKNQNELVNLNAQNYSPIETVNSANNQQADESNEPSEIAVVEDIICARFTSIENALEYVDQACTLDLSSQDHNALPEGITQLTQLTDINLSNNNLTAFPAEIFDIETLKNVNLSNNNISSIPDDFVLPDNIQNLDLSGNSISASQLSKYNRNPNNAPSELAPEQDITK